MLFILWSGGLNGAEQSTADAIEFSPCFSDPDGVKSIMNPRRSPSKTMEPS